MKKSLFLALICSLLVSACIPGIPQVNNPPVDLQATVERMASTQAAQTLESLPTPTIQPPATDTPTLEPTSTPLVETETATPTETDAGTGTPAGSPTETPDGTETPTTGTPDVTPTTTEVPTATEVVLTPPLIINTVPPNIPRGRVKIINKAGVGAYISLQGAVEGGYYPIMEYDLGRWQQLKTKAPQGSYTYVVYVGAEPMIGYFGLHNANGVTITIFKNKVTVKH
ncbi:MAG: hypothetical protein GXP40_11525 [Chloroflexi bacterium]|nr:hypothetical protein [Chloroflexota bacterium]